LTDQKAAFRDKITILGAMRNRACVVGSLAMCSQPQARFRLFAFLCKNQVRHAQTPIMAKCHQSQRNKVDVISPKKFLQAVIPVGAAAQVHCPETVDVQGRPVGGFVTSRRIFSRARMTNPGPDHREAGR